MTAKAMPSSSRKVVLVEEAMKVVQLPSAAPIAVPHSDVGLKCNPSQPGEAAAHCKIALDQPLHPGRGNPEGEKGKRTRQEREEGGERGEEVEKRGWKREGRKKGEGEVGEWEKE